MTYTEAVLDRRAITGIGEGMDVEVVQLKLEIAELRFAEGRLLPH
jgi:hypothetical protein